MIGTVISTIEQMNRNEIGRVKYTHYSNLSKENKIRILVVDDYALVRECLIAFLGLYPDFEIVGEAEDGQAAVMLAFHYRPDIVLMDMFLPRMDGVQATVLIRANCPMTQVIALTGFSEPDPVQNMLRAGAISYLVKNASIDELVQAIRDAHAGKPTLSSDATQSLISVSRGQPKLGDDLTNREREIVGLMTGGLSNFAIANQLVISQSTVKNHIANIFTKLDSKSRTQAVSLAVEHKLWLKV
ncbi:MAG: response regulator transcription factor [Chloroflexota bacterium]